MVDYLKTRDETDQAATGAYQRFAIDAKSTAIGALCTLPAQRGYTEEIEHWAWCVRNRDPENQPRCTPQIALADATIALTTNMAIRQGTRIEFKKEWFDIQSDETPEGVKPNLGQYS